MLAGRRKIPNRGSTGTNTYNTVLKGTITFTGNESLDQLGLYMPSNPGTPFRSRAGYSSSAAWNWSGYFPLNGA